MTNKSEIKYPVDIDYKMFKTSFEIDPRAVMQIDDIIKRDRDIKSRSDFFRKAIYIYLAQYHS